MTTVIEVTYVTPLVEDIGRFQHVVERGIGLTEDDLTVLGAVETNVDVAGIELVGGVFSRNLPLGLGDTGPGVVQGNLAGPTQTGRTNQLTIDILVASSSAGNEN
ncbi:hypothetical protein Ri1_14460 [Aeromonas dhakensis]|nr:hypothetical protein Ri1_14460 [Aeromonas dhakensis]